MTPRLAALAAIVLALTACSTSHPAAPGVDDSTPASLRPTPAPQQERLMEIVADPRSTLTAVEVRPGPEGYTVSSWWTRRRGGHDESAIVTSDDRFESPWYERGSAAACAVHQPHPPNTPAPAVAAFEGLISAAVPSLAPGTRAFVAGGDGATLLPFQAVARSTHSGAWKAYVVPKTAGDQAYVEGDVVLSDGRLLVLLDAWSSDRGPRRPGPEYHGLWISAGDDWRSYTPVRPRFSPALASSDAVATLDATPGASRQAPHGFVVATTRANRLYLSTDGARSFTEIRAR